MTTRLALAAAALAVAAALVAAGCGSPCQDLGNRICSCQPIGTLRDNCTATVASELGSSYGQASSADQAACQKFLTSCPDFAEHPNLCPELSTEAVMVQCGLAYDGGTP